MNKTPPNYTVKPKTKEELKTLINVEINQHGNCCDLNNIDVSLVTDFSNLFYNSKFNGDISRWDVSSVKNMLCMFYGSRFNGDISKWDIRGVTNVNSMFRGSKFNGDISGWNTCSVSNELGIFLESKMAKDLDAEDPSLEQVKSHFLKLRLEADLESVSPLKSGSLKVRL